MPSPLEETVGNEYDCFVIHRAVSRGGFTGESILAAKNFHGHPDDICIFAYPRSDADLTQNVIIGLKTSV